ncbi:MAG TPA: hypothetical protein EYH02_01570 [Ignisphaera aggregans]|uniref:Uncharacterized protein n=1 Tax=Ignisphaera aggregans TaxID=334771 RepID=A0A833DU24_9CREN|nr:hypothetical protein [Ignisphaera aggregans]
MFTAEKLKVYGVPSDLEFRETGPNTGEFVAVIQVSADLGDPASWITISHKDFRPIYATPEMEEWEEAGVDVASVRVYIRSFNGEIFTDKTEYGPIATITITVKDADRNLYPDKVDSVSVRYFNPVDGRWHTISLDETGPNTGVFRATLSIPALGTPDKVIGKTIRFIYVDPCDATGASAVFSTQVKVISWTAKIETDKKSYVLGEKVRIKVTDPDANLDPNAIDSITVHVYTDTDPAGTYVTLYETDVNTGVFVGEVLISSVPGPGRVMAREIDTVHIEYVDRYPEGYPEVKNLPITLDVSVGVVIPKPIEVPKIAAVEPETGKEVEKFRVGTLAGIKITLKNVAAKTKTVAVIAVIYDPNGVAIAVQAFKLPIAGKASADLLLSFIPKLTGTYTVKIYVVKGLTPAERIQILSPQPVYVFTVTVVE